jgi:hypothetical protein
VDIVSYFWMRLRACRRGESRKSTLHRTRKCPKECRRCRNRKRTRICASPYGLKRKRQADGVAKDPSISLASQEAAVSKKKKREETALPWISRCTSVCAVQRCQSRTFFRLLGYPEFVAVFSITQRHTHDSQGNQLSHPQRYKDIQPVHSAIRSKIFRTALYTRAARRSNSRS